MAMDYHVGQVFYFIPDKQIAVLPFRIVEKTIKQTLSGDATIYKAQCPKVQNGQPVLITEIEKSGKIMVTIDDVRVYLLDKTQRAVAQLIDSAIAISNEHFGEQAPLAVEQERTVSEAEQVDDFTKVVLPDGTLAKLKHS